MDEHLVSLKSIFELLLSKYQKDSIQVERFWKEIRVNYENPQRHYHTLTHLRNLMKVIYPLKDQLQDWECVQFAIYYHDIAYDVLRNDNEEQSANWAQRVMEALQIASPKIERCQQHILATKGHSISDDADTNLFTDADLSILGADWEEYTRYFTAIRQEYGVYPDDQYKKGRAGVLEKFLAMPVIFKTEVFKEKYEGSARNNLRIELEILMKQAPL